MPLRDAALVVFQYGTNESDLWKLDRDDYEKALAGLIDELHVAIAPTLLGSVQTPKDSHCAVTNGGGSVYVCAPSAGAVLFIQDPF